MNNRIALLWVLTALPLALAAANAAAAPAGDPPALSRVAGVGPGPLLIRAEASLVDMRDSWLGLPQDEVGLTVGRDLTSQISVELTGSVRQVGNDQRRSSSALAVGRAVVVANATGRHALTVAGGPFLEVGHAVHGTLPFAHTELAYVYRAPVGLTVLAGGGVNFALASSPYVAPPPTECPEGDSPTFCIDFGPDAQEIHAGDRTLHTRVAVGWQF